jgi:hypothetical protein
MRTGEQENVNVNDDDDDASDQDSAFKRGGKLADAFTQTNIVRFCRNKIGN